jgi:hypothetical protein
VFSWKDVLFVKSSLIAIGMALHWFNISGFIILLIFFWGGAVVFVWFVSTKFSLLRLHEYKYYSNQWGLSLIKYYSSEPIEKSEMGGEFSTYGKSRGVYRVLMGKPEGTRTLGRPKGRWKDNIQTDLQEMGWGIDWIDLAQDKNRCRALVSAVISLRIV